MAGDLGALGSGGSGTVRSNGHAAWIGGIASVGRSPVERQQSIERLDLRSREYNSMIMARARRPEYGRCTPAKLKRGMIPEAEAKWPRLTDCLNLTGLGSDPRLIQKLAARAERRPGCR